VVEIGFDELDAAHAKRLAAAAPSCSDGAGEVGADHHPFRLAR